MILPGPAIDNAPAANEIAPPFYFICCHPFNMVFSRVLLIKAALFFSLCVSLLFAQSPVLSPPVATTYLGGDVHFICTKDPSMQIAWLAPSIPSFFHNDGSKYSELNIGVPDVTLNNTIVQCVARDPSQPSKLYYSNPAMTVIQGISNPMLLFLLICITHRFSFGNCY